MLGSGGEGLAREKCGSFNGKMGCLVGKSIHGIQLWVNGSSGACGARPMAALAPWRYKGGDVEATIEYREG